MKSLDASVTPQIDDEIVWLKNFNEKLEKYQDALPCDPLVVYAIQADASRLIHSRDSQRYLRIDEPERNATDAVDARWRITAFVDSLKQSGGCSSTIVKDLRI